MVFIGPDRVLVRTATTALAVFALVVTSCTGGDGESSATTAPGDAREDVVTLGSDELGHEATIRRTDGGVAHITGTDLSDVTFGQGWASAEDRACDLADQVLKVNGERARWLGPGEEDENIESDLAWRSIGIRELAEADWESASEQVRELLSAYTAGWNAHLAEVGVDGITDWCAGAEWVRPLEPVEVYAYARSIALNASSSAVAGFIATAAPPGDPADTTLEDTAPEEAAPASAHTGAIEPVAASNGWAIGSERSASGSGMLVANPHFPWEGQLRFWEVHLTVPGELDVYGVQLSGLPGLAIGFSEEFAWTHTVSAGRRFTAYQLDLVPGSPTSYVYGEDVREMTSEEMVIEVLDEDGEVEQQTRTMWRTHYGPVLDFPGVGWTEQQTISFRDANIDNDEFVEQYVEMVQASDLDELIDLHERHNGVPLFNTVATSVDGRAWYADTSATPALDPQAIEAYEASLEADPLVSAARDNGAVLLDGSNPLFEWVELDGARDPGLVPYADQPKMEREDYVFNANDSFWMSHGSEMLEGEFSPLHGLQRTARSPRTRENATVLEDLDETGAAGADGRFDLDELAAAALANRGYTSRALLDEVVERCDGAAPVQVDALNDDDGTELLPAEAVDVTDACAVLAEWDGVYDLDRAGPPIWRELVGRYTSTELTSVGPLWAQPFDPERPVETPSGLAGPTDGSDPVMTNLARAVQILDAADVEASTPLGEVQFAVRNGTRVPIHGGNGADGTTNIVGWGTGWATRDPALGALERTPFAPRSSLATVEDGEDETVGYRINNGTSFLLAVELGEQGPRAKAFLTYGNTADRSARSYLDATQRFSAKEWRDVLLDPDEIAEQSERTTIVRG